jgi:hypothetical protein
MADDRMVQALDARVSSPATPPTSSTASPAASAMTWVTYSTTTPSTRRCATTSLLFLVTLEREGPRRLEALPLKLDDCYTRLAEGDDAAWIRRRFRAACAELGTDVAATNERLVVSWR